MWDIDRKITNHNFERTRKSTGYIYTPGNKYREAGGYLKMISCLQDSVIDSTPRIGKYINKLELYRQCPPIRAKDKACVR